jgi:2-phospho-L-lactate/phosphoenolpyruvate guanylyltransferase
MAEVTRAASADLSHLHALVPVRGLADGKARLGFALDAEERETLILGLLAHTLDALRDWPACERVHVVTSDPALLEAAAGRGAAGLIEATHDDLNAALVAAREAAMSAGATAVLCLPADLPFLSPAGLARLLDAADAAVAAGNGAPIVVVAPADARDGTNALLLSPPTIIDPLFGGQSLAAHVRAAGAVGASLQLVVDPHLGFDLDTPDDLERMDASLLVDLLRLGGEVPGASEPLPAAESR